MGRLVRMIGSGIGLASEAIASRKQARSRSPSALTVEQVSASSSSKGQRSLSPHNTQHEELPPAYNDVVEVSDERATELIAEGKAAPVDEKLPTSSKEEAEASDHNDSDSDSSGDEANWQLDEAAQDLDDHTNTQDPKLKYGIDAQPTIDSFTARVLARCPPLTHPTPQLERPVIIPQRRPGARDRGFIHAYAPDLAGKGISQDAFLSFIQNFHAASQASPLLNVIMISAGIAGSVPNHIAMITGTVVQLAVGTAMELQTRARTHSFLDEMNAKLFKPRGLYALVMRYTAQGTRPMYAEQQDINQVISKRSGQEGSSINIRKTAAAHTLGSIELPDSAELVFPALDNAAKSQDLAKANKLKKSAAFVADYYDKRAQASYLKNNPDSGLAIPQQEFSTSLSDPNHPAFRGSWLTLVSGGKIPPKAERKAKRRARKDAERLAEGRRPKGPRKAAKRARKARKRVMKQNVLYLMIVNMPTDQELEEAKTKMSEGTGGL